MINALTCAMRGRSEGEWHSSDHHQHLEISGDVSNCISGVQKDYMVVEIYD